MEVNRRVVCNLGLLMAKKNVRTITQLSKMTGVSSKALEKCLHNKATMLSYETTYRICKALGCQLGELYTLVSNEEYQLMKDRQQKNKENRRKGHVYFLKNPSNGLIKIGRSSQIETRINQLSIELKQPLELIKKIPKEDTHIAERELHELYADYRVHGEWFDLPESEIQKIKELELA